VGKTGTRRENQESQSRGERVLFSLKFGGGGGKKALIKKPKPGENQRDQVVFFAPGQMKMRLKKMNARKKVKNNAGTHSTNYGGGKERAN